MARRFRVALKIRMPRPLPLYMTPDVKSKSPKGTRLLIAETRQLRLSLDGLLEALLALDRQKDGWIWRATDHEISVDDSGDGSVTVQARRSAGSAAQRMSFDRAFVAAALIHVCFLMRVPLPRTSTKQIEVTTDGATLLMSQTIEGPSLNLASRGPRVPVTTASPTR